MRKFLIAGPLALATAAVLATPASAATEMHGGWQVGREIHQLDNQVDRAKHRGQISWREAAHLHRQVDRLEDLYGRFSRNGFTRAELRVLDTRIDAVKRHLHIERFDHNDHRGPDTYREHEGNRR